MLKGSLIIQENKANELRLICSCSLNSDALNFGCKITTFLGKNRELHQIINDRLPVREPITAKLNPFTIKLACSILTSIID